jgi:hypothetical protein
VRFHRTAQWRDPRISSFAVASAFLVVAFAFLVVIPEGGSAVVLASAVARTFIVIPHRRKGTPPPLPLSTRKNHVISTEAVHSLIVNRAAERPPYFVFAFIAADLIRSIFAMF